MDNNNSNKTSSFFKKEGFYVILFLCICIAATIAAVSVKNSRNVKNISPKTKTVSEGNISKDVAENTEEKNQEKKVDYTNALEVKNNSKTEDAKKVVSTVKEGKNEVKAVANPVDREFGKPVEQDKLEQNDKNVPLKKDFSEDPVYWNSTRSHRPHFGIDIKAKLGKPVFSVMDGKVEKIEDKTEDGMTIVINHQNGLKTVYANLDRNVTLKEGQMVKKNQQIGNVGNTSTREGYEEIGDHLHFEVINTANNANKPEDPQKYLNKYYK